MDGASERTNERPINKTTNPALNINDQVRLSLLLPSLPPPPPPCIIIIIIIASRRIYLTTTTTFDGAEGKRREGERG